MKHIPLLLDEAVATGGPVYTNLLFIGLSVIILLLLIVIIGLAELLKTAAYQKKEQEKKQKGQQKENEGGKQAQVSAAAILLFVAPTDYWGLGPYTFYLMICIIAFEIFVAWGLYATSMQLLGVTEKKRKEAEEKAKAAQPTFLEKMNASVAIEKEQDILLDHNYDGIRELDNDLPPWWKYGFYLTIVFAAVYLIHYHVSKTGKLQLAEYEDQVLAGKHDVEEYMKKAANLVDENNATLLTDDASLASGKSIFEDNCGACHGRSGEGGVGPNLTDDYWLHKGGIKDIFKTVKFGWPEKGMKSWQQDLSAKQIHEVASYIKSLHGSNPANAKEKQGDLYTEEGLSDSTKVTVTDSTQIVLKEETK